jgi:uncharacterized membrane protein
MFALFKFLHIFAMFTAVTLMFSPDIMFYRAAAAGDVRTMRRIGSLSKLSVGIGIVFFFVGIGFGLLASVVGPFSLTEGWLIAAYILVATIIALGAGVENPHYMRVAAAAEKSGDEPSEELQRLVRSPIKHLGWLSAAMYAAVIYVMVAKPFS